MSLLFGEHLSLHLVDSLGATFPGCTHVHAQGLGSGSDREVFEFARTHGLAIVTKDSDFVDLSITHGAPPKIVWLRIGNTSTSVVATLLLRQAETIAAFLTDPQVAILSLTR
jgi:predicted nuclease of predicted toxin-antitoxin system